MHGLHSPCWHTVHAAHLYPHHPLIIPVYKLNTTIIQVNTLLYSNALLFVLYLQRCIVHHLVDTLLYCTIQYMVVLVLYSQSVLCTLLLLIILPTRERPLSMLPLT